MRCSLPNCCRGPWTYEKCNKVVRVFVLLEAALLVVIGVFRLISFFKIGTFANYVITFYLFLFAILTGLTEFRVNYFKTTFYFLNFCWGKALFFIFLGSLILAYRVRSWLEIPSGVIFLVSAAILIGISIIYRKEERELWECEALTLDP